METRSEIAMTAYTQKNGEITAWRPDTSEKMVLSHEGSSAYVRVFFALVCAGLVYLIYVFIAY